MDKKQIIMSIGDILYYVENNDVFEVEINGFLSTGEIEFYIIENFIRVKKVGLMNKDLFYTKEKAHRIAGHFDSLEYANGIVYFVDEHHYQTERQIIKLVSNKSCIINVRGNEIIGELKKNIFLSCYEIEAEIAKRISEKSNVGRMVYVTIFDKVSIAEIVQIVSSNIWVVHIKKIGKTYEERKVVYNKTAFYTKAKAEKVAEFRINKKVIEGDTLYFFDENKKIVNGFVVEIKNFEYVLEFIGEKITLNQSNCYRTEEEIRSVEDSIKKSKSYHLKADTLEYHRQLTSKNEGWIYEGEKY